LLVSSSLQQFKHTQDYYINSQPQLEEELPTMSGNLLDRAREHERSQESCGARQRQYKFWTSPTALVVVMFLTLSLWCGDVLLVYAALLTVIQKISVLVFRWTSYVLDNGLFRETIEINKGYLTIIKRYMLAFVDVGGEHHSFGKQLIAAEMLRHRNAQIYCLALYFRTRQRKVIEGVLKDSERQTYTRVEDDASCR
jgi:hypothetical protein